MPGLVARLQARLNTFGEAAPNTRANKVSVGCDAVSIYGDWGLWRDEDTAIDLSRCKDVLLFFYCLLGTRTLYHGHPSPSFWLGPKFFLRIARLSLRGMANEGGGIGKDVELRNSHLQQPQRHFQLFNSLTMAFGTASSTFNRIATRRCHAAINTRAPAGSLARALPCGRHRLITHLLHRRPRARVDRRNVRVAGRALVERLPPVGRQRVNLYRDLQRREVVP